MIDSLTADRFEELESEIFTVTSIEPSQSLRLIEIVRKGQGERMGGSFSLLWQSDTDMILPQGSYVLEHGDLGQLELFIVPVGEMDGGVHYEAIFT
ncbi:MAG: hypothetical protein AAGE05_10445 [Pseudomonadota bacterium]